MSRLRADPAGPVATLPELGALAASLRRQATDLYERLARRMSDLGNDGTSSAFARISALHRASEAAGPASADRPPSAVPPIFEDEELGEVRLVSPYMAYSLAVRNSERAFAYWTHISANAPDPAVREEAERLAADELGRIRTLRGERRRMFHEERSRDGRRETPRPASVAELRREAAAQESRLAGLHERIAEALSRTGRPLPLLAEIARDEAANAERLGGTPGPGGSGDPLPPGPQAQLNAAIAQLEAAVELYLAVAEHGARDDVVSEAQNLAERAIGRLARLRLAVRGAD